jgi:hypothetical protein
MVGLIVWSVLCAPAPAVTMDVLTQADWQYECCRQTWRVVFRRDGTYQVIWITKPGGDEREWFRGTYRIDHRTVLLFQNDVQVERYVFSSLGRNQLEAMLYGRPEGNDHKITLFRRERK